MLGGMTPIVRGQCDACGTTRNLWVAELSEDTIPCAHRDRGCKGAMKVAYTGPKGWLPTELDHVRCRCDSGGNPAAPVPAAQQHARAAAPAPPGHADGHGDLNGGLDEAAALRAALAASLEPQTPAPEPAPEPEALDPCLEAMLVTSLEPAPTPEETQEERELAAKYLRAPADEDCAECAICCDELRLTSAAMRCAGGAGRAHFFHACCLSEWASQCRSQGTAPSCPECRGPVQVRRQKLQEFLREVEAAGGDAQPGLHELAQATQSHNTSGGGRSGVDAADDDWSDVKEGLWTAVGVVGVAVAVGGAIAAIGMGIEAIQQGNRSRRRAAEKRQGK